MDSIPLTWFMLFLLLAYAITVAAAEGYKRLRKKTKRLIQKILFFVLIFSIGFLTAFIVITVRSLN